MKRVLLILALVGLVGVASACGGGGEKEVTIPGTDGKVKVTTGGDLPGDFPDDFPIFEDSKLTGSVQGEQEGTTGFFVTWETDASAEDVTDFYKGELDKDPWKTAGVFSSAGGALISFTRADDEDIGGGVTVSEDGGKTTFVVFYGEGLTGGTSEEAAPPEEEAQPEEEAAPEEEQPPAEAELPEEVELPEDYPADLVPIPDDARVTDASSISSGGQLSHAISYLTKDDPDAVGDYYDEKVQGDGWSQSGRFSSGGDVSLSYENPDKGGSLVITASKSDSYEGYTEVFILLTVTE